jgi:hypothetical protein
MQAVTQKHRDYIDDIRDMRRVLGEIERRFCTPSLERESNAIYLVGFTCEQVNEIRDLCAAIKEF